MEQEFFDSAQLKAYQVLLDLRRDGVALGELSMIAMFIALNATFNLAKLRNESILVAAKEFTKAFEAFARHADSGNILDIKI